MIHCLYFHRKLATWKGLFPIMFSKYIFFGLCRTSYALTSTLCEIPFFFREKLFVLSWLVGVLLLFGITLMCIMFALLCYLFVLPACNVPAVLRGGRQRFVQKILTYWCLQCIVDGRVEVSTKADCKIGVVHRWKNLTEQPVNYKENIMKLSAEAKK